MTLWRVVRFPSEEAEVLEKMCGNLSKAGRLLAAEGARRQMERSRPETPVSTAWLNGLSSGAVLGVFDAFLDVPAGELVSSTGAKLVPAPGDPGKFIVLLPCQMLHDDQIFERVSDL